MLLIVLPVAASLLFFTSPCTQRLLFLDPGDAGRMTTRIAAGPAAAAAAEILWQVCADARPCVRVPRTRVVLRPSDRRPTKE